MSSDDHPGACFGRGGSGGAGAHGVVARTRGRAAADRACSIAGGWAEGAGDRAGRAVHPGRGSGSSASTPRVWLGWRTGRGGGQRPTRRSRSGEVIAAALTDPQALGLPFACWTLDRLAAYLQRAEKGIADQAQPDRRDPAGRRLALADARRPGSASGSIPHFAEKRGRSSPLHRAPPRAASSSASTRWGRSRPRASRASSSSARARRPRPRRRPSGQAGDRLRAAGQGLHLRRLPPGDRRGLHRCLPRADASPTGSTSWSRSRPGCRPRSSGSTRSWTT